MIKTKNEEGSISNKLLLFVALVLTFSFVLFSDSKLSAQDKEEMTITVVADEWPPYCATPGTKTPGYGIEVMKEIFKDAGYKVIFKIVPWNRAVTESRKGKYNSIIGAFKEDAPDFVFPEEAFGTSVTGVFVKKGNKFKYTGPESLKGLKIGLIKDYSYGDKLDKFFKENPKVAKYSFGDDALISNIKKLNAGRLDVVMEDRNVFGLKAKENGLSDKLVSAGVTGPPQNLYIAFSPKLKESKEYAKILSDGIKKMKKSGEFEKVLTKYGLKKFWK